MQMYTPKSLEKLKSADLRSIVMEMQQNIQDVQSSSGEQAYIQKQMIGNLVNQLNEQKCEIEALTDQLQRLKEENRLQREQLVLYKNQQHLQQPLRTPFSIALSQDNDKKRDSSESGIDGVMRFSESANLETSQIIMEQTESQISSSSESEISSTVAYQTAETMMGRISIHPMRSQQLDAHNQNVKNQPHLQQQQFHTLNQSTSKPNATPNDFYNQLRDDLKQTSRQLTLSVQSRRFIVDYDQDIHKTAKLNLQADSVQHSFIENPECENEYTAGKVHSNGVLVELQPPPRVPTMYLQYRKGPVIQSNCASLIVQEPQLEVDSTQQSQQQTSQQLQQQQEEPAIPEVPPIIEEIGSVLFEDFFIVGPSRDSLRSVIGSQPFIEKGTMPPSVLTFLRQEQNVDPERLAQREMVKNFCYPYDLPFTREMCPQLATNGIDEVLNQIILKQKESSTQDAFVIAMHGNKDYSKSISSYPQTLAAANPNLSLYCVCYTAQNFLDDPAKEDLLAVSSGVPCIFLAPITFCFMTYYPFIEFFLDLADKIYKYLKTMRSVQFMSLLRDDMRKIASLDLQNDIANFWSVQMKPLRDALLEIRRYQPCTGMPLSLPQEITNPQQRSQLQFDYMIPELKNLHFLETEWGAGIAISSLAIEDFLFILTAVSLEQKVFFFSKSLQKLTSTILTFYSLMKPFTYVFPTIFSLHMLIQGFLDSPVPLLAGINKSIEYMQVLEQEGGFSFFDKVIVDLDGSVVICQDARILNETKLQMVQVKRVPKMCDDYFIVNPRLSKQFPTIFKRKKAPSVQQANTENLVEAYNTHHRNGSTERDNGIIELSKVQKNAAAKIIVAVRDVFQSYFLAYFPQRNDTGECSVESIRAKILKKAVCDKKFIKKFVQTLTFTTYTEEYYAVV